VDPYGAGPQDVLERYDFAVIRIAIAAAKQHGVDIRRTAAANMAF
jgi:hypothetical protein